MEVCLKAAAKAVSQDKKKNIQNRELLDMAAKVSLTCPIVSPNGLTASNNQIFLFIHSILSL